MGSNRLGADPRSRNPPLVPSGRSSRSFLRHAPSQGWEEGLAAAERGDYATALRLWRPLADQGYPRAQHDLGIMYEKGQGVPQDYTEAVKWYRKAAEQGFAPAENNLGVLYENGHGVPQDYVRAHRWYSLAIRNAEIVRLTSKAEVRDRATRNRDRVAAKMTPAQIVEAQRLAGEPLRAHAAPAPATAPAVASEPEKIAEPEKAGAAPKTTLVPGAPGKPIFLTTEAEFLDAGFVLAKSGVCGDRHFGTPWTLAVGQRNQHRVQVLIFGSASSMFKVWMENDRAWLVAGKLVRVATGTDVYPIEIVPEAVYGTDICEVMQSGWATLLMSKNHGPRDKPKPPEPICGPLSRCW